MTKLSIKALGTKLSALKILPFFTVLAAIQLGGCKSESKKEAEMKARASKPKVVVAEAYVVKPMRFSNTYTASGSLLPNEEIEVHPEMSGRVTSISFREGSPVRKGQVLVQLFDADLRAQVQRLQAQKRLQLSTEQRQRQLVKIGGISKQDYESTQAQTQYVNSDIAVAEAAVSKMRVLAPFDGIIGIRNISVGAIVSPTTTVATLQQVNNLKMDFSVPDQYRSQMRIGGKVLFSVDGRLDTLSGTIAAMDPGADAATRTVRIRAMVPNQDRTLNAGSFAHVVIPLETNDHALMIPSQCIIPTTRDKKVAVLRNGKAQLATVLVGDRTAERIEVTSGLQSGDTILTTALMQIKPNMDVKVKKLVQ